MSFAIMLPADDSHPAELREMSSERSVYEQIREMIGDLVEIVRARGLHDLAPELWPVMLIDDNGHAKGLPLNRRAGLLYGGEIAGDVVLCQERKRPLVIEDLTGFTREEAWQLQAPAARRRGPGELRITCTSPPRVLVPAGGICPALGSAWPFPDVRHRGLVDRLRRASCRG